MNLIKGQFKHKCFEKSIKQIKFVYFKKPLDDMMMTGHIIQKIQKNLKAFNGKTTFCLQVIHKMKIKSISENFDFDTLFDHTVST